MSTPDDGQKRNFPQVIQQQYPTASVGSVTGVLGDIGKNAVTSRAELIRHNTDEGMTWQESPSMALLIPPSFKYLVIFIVLLIGFSMARERFQESLAEAEAKVAAQVEAAQRQATKSNKVKKATPRVAPSDDQQQARTFANLVWYLPYFIGLIFAIRLFILFLRLKTTKYSATSQRLVIEKGIIRTVNVPYELHRLGNAVIVKPLLLRPFGVANMFIGSPSLPLLGLRNAEYVRDILRTGGQLEAQRIDKIRWR
jgi:hypothetical protein